MPVDSSDPLVTERDEGLDGLGFSRQPPPAGAASFSATYISLAGTSFDPPGREGAGFLVSQLVTSGAGRLNRIKLARELDRLGATLQAHADSESAEVTVWGPAAAWERLLDLLADAVLRPRFEESDIARVRRQTIERQLREATQPASRAELELFRAVFPPGHPYRLSGIGTRRTLERLRREDLRRFHREHFTREGAAVVVTSPKPKSAVERAVRRRFVGFARDSAPAVPRLPRAPSLKNAPRRVTMEGRSQVEVRIGGPSIARADSDYAALYLVNEVLGGRPLLARLFQQVRERHGLAYHASSDVESMRWGGYWMVQAGTGPERADKVVELLTGEVGRMGSQEVKSGELREIRESAIGAIPLSLETTTGAHQLALDVTYYDLPGDYYRRWPRQLRRVKASEMRSAARRGMDLAAASTVLAGPSKPTHPA